jgi:multidrug transporter EmrE-like cation transporter
VLGHASASQPSRRTFRSAAIGALERAVSYLLVLLGILLNVGAQVALKWAAQGLSPAAVDGAAPAAPLSFSTIAEDPLRVLLNPWFLLGLVLYAVSVVNWLVVLARMELSVAYPLMSAAYILTLLAGALLFKEPLSATRVVGTLVIIVGVILITRPVPLAHG